MNLLWTENAWEEYLYWSESDKKLVKRINLLIKDIMRSPFEGIGKPEGLKFDLAGKWSRRIDEEHRLVYEITRESGDINLKIIQCRYHYR